MIILEHIGDLVIKNDELQEESQMLENDLIYLNLNKLQGRFSRILHKAETTA
jgi:hypothetical protein